MTVDPKVRAAQIEAEIAKKRLLGSAHQLQERISPTRLAHDALETAKDRGTIAAQAISGAAQRRPGLFAAVGIGFLALVARRRIGRLFRRKKHVKELVASSPAKPALPRPAGEAA